MIPKAQKFRDEKYLKTLRGRQCRAMNLKDCMGDIVAAHLGGNKGTGTKGDDSLAGPLCFAHHSEEHKGVVTFWRDVMTADPWLMQRSLQALNFTDCLKYLVEQGRGDEAIELIKRF